MRMITPDLIEYIKSQLNKNIPKNLIISHLIEVGWRIDDINEGFENVESSELEEVPTLNNISENLVDDFSSTGVDFEEKKEEPKQEVKEVFDKYRELPEGLESQYTQKESLEEKKEPASSLELLKIWVPTTIKPKIEEVKSLEPELKQEISKQEEVVPEIKPESFSNEIKKMEEFNISSTTEIEPYKIEVQEEKLIVPNSSVINFDKLIVPKDEIPSILNVPVEIKEEKPISFTPSVINLNKLEPYKEELVDVAVPKIEIPKQPQEEPKIEFIPTINKNVIEQKPEEVKHFTPTVNTVYITPVTNTIKEPEAIFVPEITVPIINKDIITPKSEEVKPFTPTVNTAYSTPVANPVKEPEAIFVPEITVPIINKESTVKPNLDSINIPQKTVPIKPVTVSPASISDIFPKSAMISSYSQDLMSTVNDKEVAVPKKKNLFLMFGIIIFIVSIISGMIFAFVEGYLKLPGSNLSLSVVKKDPKTVILNAPSLISKFKSYKTETNINISSPSLSNITTGLSSGNVVTSNDKDSISVNLSSLNNNKDGKISFDYLLKLKSSILKSDIISDWKYNGSKLFVSVPDLKQIFGKDTPEPAVVSMEPNQLGLINGEFSTDIQDVIKKIDIYNILSNDVPLYVKNETSSILSGFINTLEYRELEGEFIHGVETYHYEMIADRPATKKMLSQFVDLLIAQLPPDQKKNLDEAIGASSISSFEVWTGKNDDNLYQFKFTLEAPLSKILGLNDSGIAGNEVRLDWITTFYDIDIDNNIVIPTDDIDIKEFVNNIRNIKVKNIISTFKPQATMLKNAIGSYGLRSNPMGSCTNPNPGSLFSPQGHTKGADSAISGISNSMISLLTATNGAGSCYSTSGAWALAAPLYITKSSTPVDDDTVGGSFYCTDSNGITTTTKEAIKGPSCN